MTVVPPSLAPRLSGWFLALPPRRLLRDQLRLAAGLLLLLLSLRLTTSDGATAGISAAMGILVLSYGALRLRPLAGSRRAFLRQEVAVALPSLLGASLLMPLLLAPFPLGAEFLIVTAVTGAIFALGYGGLRALVLLLAWWNRIRQQRLTWAFVHSTLMSLLLVALPIILLLLSAIILSVWEGESIQSPLDLYVVSLLTLLTLLVPLVLLMILVAGVLLVLLLPSILVAALVARQTTRRLDALAAMAERLRGGDLSARVAVQGQDEVARFQQDFNMMAASLEEAMQAVRAERERVEGLLAQRRELVASVSHELRTPIAVMHGQLEQMQAQPQPDERVETLLRESGRLARLVDDLFALSRAEAGRLTLRVEPIELAAVVQHCVQATMQTAWQQRRVEVVADLPPELPLVRADRERLAQVLFNLLHNAIRHTAPGGIVALLAEATPEAVYLHVRDTGEGIPAEALPRIWEPFFRARAERPGTGLGLPLARQLVEAMGGRVTVESEVGQGSTFTVTLTRAE